MTVPAPRADYQPRAVTMARTVAVRKILVDHLVTIGATAALVRTIPALLAALEPHLNAAPIAVPPKVLIDGRPADEIARGDHPLSNREVQVLQLVAEGQSTRDIGRRLGIAESTAKTHVTRTLRRLGVHDRAEAVAVGFRRGILR